MFKKCDRIVVKLICSREFHLLFDIDLGEKNERPSPIFKNGDRILVKEK
jgi:hypothetical protein